MPEPAVIEVEQEITEKQLELLEAYDREVLLSGSFGSGKTWGICLKAVQHATIPGNLVLLCRKTFADLRQTTLRVLLRGEPPIPPVLRLGTYTHNKNEHLISLHGGGDIFYGGFDRELKLASLNLGAACVDEAIEVVEDEYMMILGRLRNPSDPHPQICLATNPGPPTHYLYKRFIDKDTSRAGCRVIWSKSDDNPFLPESYTSDILANFTGEHKARYVDGQWIQFEGLVYKWDNRDAVLREAGHIPSATIVAGVDEGYTNPFVCLVLQMYEGTVHVLEEYSARERIETQKIAAMKDLRDRYNISMFHVDPSAADLIGAMNANDLTATGANNEVFAGITQVQQLFGSNRLTISPSKASELVKELDSYLWKDGKDEPIKINDHHCDALRYGVMGLKIPHVDVHFIQRGVDEDGDWVDNGSNWMQIDNPALWDSGDDDEY